MFHCTEHPNHRMMVTKWPDVECFSPDWWDVIPLSIIAILLYCVGFVSWIIYLVCVAPRRVGSDEKFCVRYQFIWDRWHPCSWWFSLVMLTFAIALNLIATFTSNGYQQACFSSVLITIYCIMVNNLKPWKFVQNTFVDASLKFCLGLLMLLGYPFITNTSQNLEQIQDEFNTAILVVVVLPVVGAVCILLQVVWRKRIATTLTLSERLVFAQRFRDVMSMASLMSNKQLNYLLTHQLPDNDRITLLHAIDVVVSSVLQVQPGGGMGKKRIMEGRPYKVVSIDLIEDMFAAHGMMDAPAQKERQLLQRVATYMSQKRTIGLRHSESKKSVTRVFNEAVGLSWKDLFESMDCEKDGRLTKDEFMHALDAMDGVSDGVAAFSEEELQFFFDSIDLDGDGDVSLNEFCAILDANVEKQNPPDNDPDVVQVLPVKVQDEP
eukprot:gnl/MRDRNA2_/MRDRNA2_170079_c0_seq1.p1 gnl/MRDRNA2_/MRDRNA2_170079_c0~~gnl/MRDRNA2_/MRDRNA2_170079_c0_seq1.p1  ORF type:complete len:475 (+),score=72.54 gnl/MRDRNA2_/MRDRNA2_170079_c0_seq1:119-1426(+)